jgi:hypothetical protein
MLVEHSVENIIDLESDIDENENGLDAIDKSIPTKNYFIEEYE